MTRPNQTHEGTELTPGDRVRITTAPDHLQELNRAHARVTEPTDEHNTVQEMINDTGEVPIKIYDELPRNTLIAISGPEHTDPVSTLPHDHLSPISPTLPTQISNIHELLSGDRVEITLSRKHTTHEIKITHTSNEIRALDTTNHYTDTAIGVTPDGDAIRLKQHYEEIQNDNTSTVNYENIFSEGKPKEEKRFDLRSLKLIDTNPPQDSEQ